MSDFQNRLSALSPEKRSLFIMRMLNRSGEAVPDQTISRRESSNCVPLSFAQQRLWFLDQLDPLSSSYNMPAVLRLSGALDPSLLQLSLEEIVLRHESLRTSFVTVDGQPRQLISAPTAFKLPIIDLQPLSPEIRQAEAHRLAAEEAATPFDLSHGSLLRATLLRLDEDEHVLLLTMHHIVSDGWSMGILIRELTALYDAFSAGRPSPLDELPIQYADFAQWQRDWLQGAALERQLSYWKEQLAGVEVLELPTDRARPVQQSYRGALQSLTLSNELAEGLKELSRSEGVTLFMTLLASFQVLLSKYTGQEDIAVGTPIANRNRKEIEGLIGFFVNTLVLRSDLSGDPSFRELLGRVSRTAQQAYDHQDLPFEKLVEELQPERSLSHNPLFQVMFILQNAPLSTLDLPGLRSSFEHVHTNTSVFEMTVALHESPEGLMCWFEYNSDIFEAATIERMAGHFHTLLEAVVRDPAQSLSSLPLLTQAERRQLLFEFNDSEVDYPQYSNITQLFEQQAELHPHAVAVVSGDRHITYGELNERANQLAHYLLAEGVGVETVVAVLMERSVELFVALLGIVKAGAAYLPLDIAYPEQRLAYMLGDSSAELLLTRADVRSLPAADNIRTIRVDAERARIETFAKGNPLPQNVADNLVYLIYTSGSTGQPKGVMVSQKSLINAYMAWADTYNLSRPETNHLQTSSFSFDVFSGDFVRALCSGGKLVVCPQDILLSPDKLYELMLREKINYAEFVPAVLRNLIQHLDKTNQSLDFMRVLVAGSDTWLASEYKDFKGFCGSETQLVNSYGVTEACVDSTCFQSDAIDLESNVNLPIGSPFPNSQVYLLDKHLEQVPVGIPGEMFIGGMGVARGYFKRPAQTAERFIPNPFSSKAGERLYRTGDLARYRPDGRIEFIGRIDHQVKVRGFRIELGEIESALGNHPAIRECVVIVREDVPGDKRIAAYFSVNDEASLNVSELRSHLQEGLPDYMIPSAFVQLDALPLTPNGKIDRRALPAPDETSLTTSEYVAPRTPVEELLAGIWVEVLGVRQVGVFDNFFDLGGHSLLATKLILRVRETFQFEFPLRSLFEHPSVAELATEIERAQLATEGLQVPPIERVSRERELPLSFGQHRLWFLDQLDPLSSSYNMPGALRLSGALDSSVLQLSLQEIIRRHESLRTSFVTVNGQPRQLITELVSFNLPIIDLQHLAPEIQQSEVKRLAGEEAATPFDLAQGSLLRATLLRLDEDEHVLLLTMHHIVSDGWSMGILIRELTALYDAFSAGRPSPLDELPIQYADFAQWQRDWLQGEALDKQLGHWKEQLTGVEVLELPTDRARPVRQSYRGALQSLTLSHELSEGLMELSRSEGVTLFMTLLASFQVLLSKYTGQEDIAVGTPIANRNRKEIEGLIGFFVNTLVMRGRIKGESSFKELLKEIREVALGAYTHQDLPFEKLVEELQPERSLSHNPLFQVMFNLSNFVDETIRLPGISAEPLFLDDYGSKFDLTLYAEEQNGRVKLDLIYNLDLFDHARMVEMLRQFEQLSSQIVATPDVGLAHLSLITPEAKRLLPEPAQSLDFEWTEAVHRQFSCQAARVPQRQALLDKEGAWTYRQLEERSNRLANYLCAQGVVKGDVVAVYGHRDATLVWALLGIMKAGAAFMILDPAYPAARLSKSLEAAQAVGWIQLAAAAELPQTLDDTVNADRFRCRVRLPQGAEADTLFADYSSHPPAIEIQADDLAYLAFTSGSTGTPKGIKGTHAPLAHFLRWHVQTFGLDETDRFSMLSGLSHDPLLRDVLTPLVLGASLSIPETEFMAEPGWLSHWMKQEGISVAHLTPALEQLLTFRTMTGDANATQELSSLRYAFFGGDVLKKNNVVRLKEIAPRVACVNFYGATETPQAVGYYVVPDSLTVAEGSGNPSNTKENIIIGGGIEGVQLLVLNSALQLAGIGELGEIYVRTPYLSRGYLNDENLTRQRFINNPFGDAQGDLLYRTGDLARYLPDGQVEFAGRADQQIKLRGFRIELGEIESVLSGHLAVRECAVIVREDVPGDKRMVAYLVAEQGQAIDTEELRNHLQNQLPGYMIPSAFMQLDALPLTPNGKIDRRALPAIAGESGTQREAFVPARTPLEQKLAEIWCELLRLERVGVNDNFFSLGGHSLLATQLISRVRSAFQVSLPLRRVFDSPTVAALAAAIEKETGRAQPVAPRIVPRSREEYRTKRVNLNSMEMS